MLFQFSHSEFAPHIIDAEDKQDAWYKLLTYLLLIKEYSTSEDWNLVDSYRNLSDSVYIKED